MHVPRKPSLEPRAWPSRRQVGIIAPLGVMAGEVGRRWDGLGGEAEVQGWGWAGDRLAQCIKCARRPPSPRESPCEGASPPVQMMSSLKTGPVPVTSVSASLQHRAWGRAKLNKCLKERRNERKKRKEEGQTDEVRDNQRGKCLIAHGMGYEDARSLTER